eukprot:6321155-Pyramimonas_sp.AAC.1
MKKAVILSKLAHGFLGGSALLGEGDWMASTVGASAPFWEIAPAFISRMRHAAVLPETGQAPLTDV